MISEALKKLERVTEALLKGEQINDEDKCTDEEIKLCLGCEHLTELQQLTIKLSGIPDTIHESTKLSKRVRPGRNKKEEDDNNEQRS